MLKRKWSNKQYCGDVESDPFEFAYRGSVFDPFKEVNNVPTVEEHMHSSSSDTTELIENIELPAHRLSANVRQQYLRYLDRVLRINYNSWLSSNGDHNDSPFTDDDLKQCAETIEMRAVQSCMITSLYRGVILQMIAEIRKQTALGMIHPNLTDVKFKPAVLKKECCHVSVQTDSCAIIPPLASGNRTTSTPLDNVPVVSLEEKMRLFEGNCSFMENPSINEPTSNWHNATPLQVKTKVKYHKNESNRPIIDGRRPHNDAMDDEILKELQAMFEPADEEENIFEWSEDQTQVKAIINEIENAESVQNSQSICSAENTVVSSPKIDSIMLAPAVPQKSNTESADLRCSMWPCELHMQRMKLRSILVRIAEENYRRYEHLVNTEFISLFGVDDGEEQDLGPYSPSIELNAVLVSSCRQRIAKWVVQSLMRPLNDGLIANRFLFKKLAKRLADGIIYMNQYPDKKFIRNYIDDYFCTHNQITSIEDIT
ncbi:uncharacterized protein LOC128720848 [Anopheles nili]|uniref:uncharacterized protein LOC128720848 n=1 Tax=Anopheles nili TaxID=185578 RepID=UPI00237ACEA3|nr:uncharacterized protein LOC128720848 [Anopheles nili]